MADESFEENLNRGFRWPQQGDRPFTQSPDWRSNAYIDPYGHGRLTMMITGYKKAGDLMVEGAAKDSFDQSALVFPIVFTYRQFIELSLKGLIAHYGHTVGVQAIWNSHDLEDLWKAFRKVLDGYGVVDEEGTDDVVAGIVAEFDKVDPQSFSYRYPVDTKGKHIPIAHNEVDLGRLADVMKGLDGYFNGCDGYLDELQKAGP